jgi:RNA polymerase sigma-B factor
MTPEGLTELALFAAYRENPTSQLKDAIISRYLDLVPAIVRKFRGRAEWEDLVQVGYVGLIKALENYDPSHSAKFLTYATHCVQGELRHYIRDRVEVIRRPRWLRGLSRDVASCIESFLHRHHRLPSVSEIAAAINVAEEGVVEILRAG